MVQGKIFRVSHLGTTTIDIIRAGSPPVERTLGECGWKSAGRGVVAAQIVAHRSSP